MRYFLSSLSAATFLVGCFCGVSPAQASLTLPFTVTMNEAVTVTGTPQIAVDVGGVTRYATYTSGSGTAALVFTLTPQVGDVDMDGITLSSPLQLNGGSIKDAAGNDATLAFTLPNTSALKVNYPSVGMDFTADSDGRYTFNGSVYNDIASFFAVAGGSFTRTTSGSYFDNAGVLQTAAVNTPRFDYDPVTHLPKGLLVEAGSTNLFKYSSDLTVANWSKISATAAGASGIAPDGTTTASLLTATSVGTNTGFTAQNVTGSFSPYTLSVYVKAGSSSRFKFQPNSQIDSVTTGFTTTYDLSTGTAAVGSSYGAKFTSVSASMQAVGNGWYRCSTTFTPTGTTFNTTINSWLFPYMSGTDPVGSNVLVWGAQIEVKGAATSFIPTTSASASRGADVLSFSSGGALSAFQGTDGTFYVEGGPQTGGIYAKLLSNASQGLLEVADTTARIGSNGSSTYITANIGSGSFSSGVVKSSVAWTSAARRLAGNAGSVTTAADTIASRSVVYVGSGWGTANFIYGYVRRLSFYPVALTSAQLQTLTQ